MSSKKPFSYDEFREIYSKVPRLSVDVVVTSQKGIALTLRSIEPHKGMWHLPGSTVLYGESATETALRVAQDELNVTAKVEKLLGYIEYNEEPDRGFGRSLSLVFLCSLVSGDLTPDGDAEKAEFFPALPDNLIPCQKTFLEKELPILKI